MSNIIYGVAGEGSGHSSRARLVATHLIAQGHRVKIVSYDRGYRNLKTDFDVFEVVGLTIVSEDNLVSKRKTLKTNLAKLPEGRKAINRLRSLFKDFAADCVITDFEPLTAHLAQHYQLPLISIDNQHRMRYMNMDCPNNLEKEAFITQSIIRAMVPKPWVSLVTTFHTADTKNAHTFLFPPLVRESVMNQRPSDGEHILVYLTSGFESLLKVLPQFSDQKFIVYGYDKNCSEGNIQFKPFCRKTFPEDLCSAKGVIATAGFTLISECLHLGKPFLAFPMQGQFEQQLNAAMLERQALGYQSASPDAHSIDTFLNTLEQLRAKLKDYPRQGNIALKIKLDQLLANDMAQLKSYRR